MHINIKRELDKGKVVKILDFTFKKVGERYIFESEYMQITSSSLDRNYENLIESVKEWVGRSYKKWYYLEFENELENFKCTEEE